MKVRNLLLALVAVSASMSMYAQPAQRQGDHKMGKMMTAEQKVDMKTKAMATKLMLSDSQKPKFEATYKAFLTDLQKTKPAGFATKGKAAKCASCKPGEKCDSCKAAAKGDTCKSGEKCDSCKPKGDRMDRKEKMLEGMSDAQITKMIEDRMDMQQARLDINKSYYKKFSAFLTPKQVVCVLGSANRRPNAKEMKGHKPMKRGAHMPMK